MSNMHCHKLFLPCLLCRCMQIFAGLLSTRSENMSLQEVTLDRITKSNAHMVMVVLRPVYHEMKQLPGKDKGTWWKSIVRLVDQKGQGLYAEIREFSEGSVRKRAQEFYQPKYIQLTQAVVMQNSPFLSGFSADVTNNGKVSPVAEAHASAMKLRSLFPTARSNIVVLAEHCEGKERADVIGKVTRKEMPAMRVQKMTLWLKDVSLTANWLYISGAGVLFPRETKSMFARWYRWTMLCCRRSVPASRRAVSTGWIAAGIGSVLCMSIPRAVVSRN